MQLRCSFRNFVKFCRRNNIFTIVFLDMSPNEMERFGSDFAQRVAKLCYQKFETLPKSGKPILGREWTSLAAVITQVDQEISISSLTTGSKCIGQSKLSASGDIINDSHAEVLARRGFLRYLYDQIELTRKGQSKIFINDGCEKVKIRERVTFHLFTSQTPCGDASIFPNQFKGDECETVENTRRRPYSSTDYSSDSGDTETKRIRLETINDETPTSFGNQAYLLDNSITDIHRTGAKCLSNRVEQDPKLPGKWYHVVGSVRTKPGRGDPTLSVSCSDKILKWNYVGIEGALLASIIEPIYLSSIIVGCNEELYSRDAMYRAVIYRNPALSVVRPLKETPVLLHVDLEFKFSKSSRHMEVPLKPSPCSIVWCDLSTGKNHQVYVEGRRLGWTNKQGTKCEPLLVSKRLFLRYFKEFAAFKCDHLTYAECKRLSIDYQQKWKQFRMILGEWTEKDKHLHEFK